MTLTARGLLLCLAVSMTACASTPAEIRTQIASFHDDAGAGHLDAIRRYYPKPSQTDWERYMQRRAALGRMIRTTEAKSESASGHFRVVMVHHNTEFERGHALELFQFRIDDAGMRMSSYSYQVGKQLWCPTLKFSGTQCSIEDAPAPAGGRAAK